MHVCGYVGGWGHGCVHACVHVCMCVNVYVHVLRRGCTTQSLLSPVLCIAYGSIISNCLLHNVVHCVRQYHFSREILTGYKSEFYGHNFCRERLPLAFG